MVCLDQTVHFLKGLLRRHGPHGALNLGAPRENQQEENPKCGKVGRAHGRKLRPSPCLVPGRGRGEMCILTS